MSLRRRLRTVLCCVVLEFGALTGVPMRPDEIQNLLQALSVPKLAQEDPERNTQRDRPDGEDAAGQ